MILKAQDTKDTNVNHANILHNHIYKTQNSEKIIRLAHWIPKQKLIL